MTTIVYDAKIRRMASDSRAFSGSSHPIGAKRKIHRIEAGKYKGSLLGVSSTVPGMNEFVTQWVTGGMSKEAFGTNEPDFEALLVKVDGSRFFFNNSIYPSGPIEADFIAIGSGCAYALGAFRAGADMLGAVNVAIECDPFSEPPIVTLQLDTSDANQPSKIGRVVRLFRKYRGTATQ
ncbi:peptidase S14 [Rhizobium johnstonii]|jgi:hypothetical protein|uniref:Peptidase S14 n=1 Tax=Rhizobium leguminosarum TaxID=384 RepID=A0A4Q8XSE4_RHILE|nr:MULTISPECIES: peptidase S14 [Rhizobium]KPN25947.1 peptidase S14 [Rhizobium brockwellii]OAV55053.1 peptidase S14 [Rhizobium sp. WYCCWR10014]QIO56134.1 peptidase S14 [Rhizobium leguminosarum bv. trifolii]QIO70445.1 peptidase S14 [Rhizobium leguminosarum bv. trifolii]QIO77448.1 peptidase S14 [Rhizobium leguminosarum bv. trifolii]